MKKTVLAIVVAGMVNIAFAQTAFDGPYIGVSLGHAWGKDSGKEYIYGSLSGYTQETQPSGTVYGALVGYNWVKPNNSLLGIEFAMDGRSQKDSSYQNSWYGSIETNYPTKTDFKSSMSLRGRVGKVFNNQTLAYLTGGYTMARIKTTFEDLQYGSSQSSSTWKGGWTLGLGVEHNLNRSTSLRLEYNYADYGHRNAPTDVVYYPGYLERQQYTEQSIKMALIYRFGAY